MINAEEVMVQCRRAYICVDVQPFQVSFQRPHGGLGEALARDVVLVLRDVARVSRHMTSGAEVQS